VPTPQAGEEEEEEEVAISKSEPLADEDGAGGAVAALERLADEDGLRRRRISSRKERGRRSFSSLVLRRIGGSRAEI